MRDRDKANERFGRYDNRDDYSQRDDRDRLTREEKIVRTDILENGVLVVLVVLMRQALRLLQNADAEIQRFLD